MQCPPSQGSIVRGSIACSRQYPGSHRDLWLIPDPPEPGEGALPDCKSWAPVGLCPASRGRFPVPWPTSPSSAEALDTTRSSLCGRGSPQLRAGGRTHTPQPTTGPSSPRLPSGPPVNAAAQQECGRLWQFAHPRPLSLLQRGLAPRSKGKAPQRRGTSP